MKWLTPQQTTTCLWKAAVKTIAHDGIEHAGYLAFLGLLALFPFLVFTFSVIGFLGQGPAGTEFITSVMHVLPDHITSALKPRIVEIISGPPQGLLTVSILGAIWTASSAVEGIRTVLNRAYHVASPPAYWLRRTLSIAQLLVFTFVTISGMIIILALQIIAQHIEDWFGFHLTTEDRLFFSKAIFLTYVGLLFVAVSSIYYTVPNIKQRFISVAPGAILVVIGWLGVAYLFTQYLLHFNQVQLIYGSLGGIIAALVFFYVCNMIFIFGAEFNYQIIDTLDIHLKERDAALQNNRHAS